MSAERGIPSNSTFCPLNFSMASVNTLDKKEGHAYEQMFNYKNKKSRDPCNAHEESVRVHSYTNSTSA